MALSDFLADLDQLLADGSAALTGVKDNSTLEAARIEFLGAKSGRLKAAQQKLGTVDKSEKPAAGKRFNEVKQSLEAAFQAAQERMNSSSAGASDDTYDI